jgi:hypothetical protein
MRSTGTRLREQEKGRTAVMTELGNFVLQHLRVIREQLDKFSERQLEMIQRFGNLEVQVANVSVPVDRIDARLDHVERRLGLIEA